MTTLTIPEASLVDHVLVLGKTGSGKTYFAKGVVEASAAQVAFMAGYSQSGTWDTYVSRARSDGLIDRRHGCIIPGPKWPGEAPGIAVDPYDLGALHAAIRDVIDEPLWRILSAVIRGGGKPVPVAEALSEAGYAANGTGTTDTYLSRLRSLQLLERGTKGVLVPTKVVFPNQP